MSGAHPTVARTARRQLLRNKTVTVPLENLVFGAPAPMTLAQLAQRTDDTALPSRTPAQWPELSHLSSTIDLPRDVWHSDSVVGTRVWRSSCLAITRGHEAVADAYAAGHREIDVTVRRGTTKTPLQSLLLEMGWLDGQLALYQPIGSRDLADWPVVRGCTDRLEMMKNVLADLEPHCRGSYLDVASSYGWFVAKMTDRGFDGWGIERDREARRLGRAVYGLDPVHVLIGDCTELLDEAEPFDVVSCMSLLHHFVSGRESCSAEQLMARLSRVTRRVLFVDTGEGHEKWLRRALPGWTPEYVGEWLTRHGDFDRVVALGTDHDDRGRFAGNYGRTLFACIRD